MNTAQAKAMIKAIKPIEVTFEKPIGGFWDGGPKKGGTFQFHFRSGGYDKHWDLKHHVEIGSYELNFFIRRPISDRVRSLAKRYIQTHIRVPCTVE